ncbi:sigma-70 family RNA polymerase sigma factor [Aeromicrobium sp. CF3.5]|uniref:sigma-70 family RNA polymerase sigma factor n=1 Tax=Aeromicrobium sp. CF3.5 TaxID=3373078 RepID=UPI003EE568C4
MNAASDSTTNRLLADRIDAEPARLHEIEAEIVRLHLPLATALAHRYLDRGADRDDLVQVASLALVKAMRGFDPDKGAFAAFATATILGEIKRYFRDVCWTVKLPRRLQELQVDITRASAEHWQQHSTAPTSDHLAATLGVDAAEVCEARAASGCFTASSLDLPVTQGSTMSLGDLVVDESDDQYGHVDDLATVGSAMSSLDASQRELLDLRFYQHLTQQQIADRTGVSQMQVSRRLKRLLADLRTAMGPIAA